MKTRPLWTGCTDLDLHQRSLAHTGEEIVGSRRGGLIEQGEEVEWRARHLGWLGLLADFLFLERHMKRILEMRNAAVKREAEGMDNASKRNPRPH
jgi:hypothetical protein